jgi:hypothetical protein
MDRRELTFRVYIGSKEGAPITMTPREEFLMSATSVQLKFYEGCN